MGRTTSLAHEEDERTNIVFRCGFPVLQQNCINQHPGFAINTKEESQGLAHQILTEQTEENANRVDELADRGDRVCDGNRPRHFDDEIIAFLSYSHLNRSKKFTSQNRCTVHVPY